MDTLKLSEVLRFAEGAEKYCELIERRAEYAPLQFTGEIIEALSLILGVVGNLPEVKADEYNKTGPNEITKKESGVLSQEMDKKFGKYAAYTLVFNPYEESDLVSTTIGDDLADIYGDLKEGLDIYKKGERQDIQEAVWQWKFGFQSHWGRHLLSVLQPLCEIRRSDLLG